MVTLYIRHQEILQKLSLTRKQVATKKERKKEKDTFSIITHGEKIDSQVSENIF
jgi:hypothetical protein